jgi:hypothetical protein
MREVYDSVRRQWVAATPEEVVRQLWLKKMVGILGYPREYFAIEKELRTLPHLQRSSERIPDRRADIIFFAPGIHPDHSLFPLLMIECKSIKLTSEALQQVLGYNTYVGALYIAVVNDKGVLFRNRDQEVDFMPSYEKLIASLK